MSKSRGAGFSPREALASPGSLAKAKRGLKPALLLVASTTGYQVRSFAAAAERVGAELVLATDRCHILDDPWGDRAVAIRFDDALAPAGLEAVSTS